jgi:hypothetical protein
MKQGFRDHAHALPVLVILGLAVSGCGQTVTLLETKVLPEPTAPAGEKNLPQAYPRSQINDPELHRFAQEFKTWALQQRTVGVTPGPPFERVEVLPPTQTVLPYGVGAFEQDLRLPNILTTGPGWASLNPEEKEAVAAQAYRKLSRGLEALKLEPALRPTLTIQTPSGLQLAWMNDLNDGPRNIHGDDSQPLAAPQPPSSQPLAPPPPRPVDR